MLRRIRAGFLVLGLILVVLLGLLLSRAFVSLEREREARHAAVATRVFDESERALGEFLKQEEERPPAHYFASTLSGEASPLAHDPIPEFVVGYFQIDAGGALTTPHEGSDRVLLRLRSAVAPNAPAAKEKQAELADLDLGSLKKEAAKADQVPGTTRTVQRLDLLTGRLEPESDDVLAEFEEERREYDETLSSYGVLRQLNLATKARRQRAPLPSVFASEPESLADAKLLAAATPRESTAPLLARLGSSPMAGAMLDREGLIIYRTVLIPDAGPYQQGILLDLARFTRWLEARVLGESGLLEFIALDFENADGLGFPEPAANRFVYQHRFGEPFEALTARVSLTPLPDEGGTRYVYAIGLLLIVASTLGLWAVYRRVAATVHFAERRSNFVAAVSHELKTPLTAIRMHAEMLRDGMVQGDEKQREYFATITSESERLTRLINNVLEFSRLEGQKAERPLTRESLEEPLRDVVKLLRPYARSQEFSLVLEIDAGLPPVAFDRDALQQLLFNLIDNALKYARTAERKEILVHCFETAGGVTLRVRDYGPGVARAHQPHLFEAFYRGEDELTRRTKGTGIGLALVRGLAEEMGARVSARNHADGGFEVEIRLPTS